MRQYRLWATAAALLLAGSVLQPAAAFFLYGPQFLTACESADALQLGVCLGYIQGVADALEDRKTICLPTVGAKELRLVVIKSLQEKPDDIQQPAHSLISRALGAAFPCTKP